MGGTRTARLHIVTGKGGTGKTSVAAALALHLASGGHNVLLIEVEGRQGIAQLFDVPQLPYEERKVAIARGGGDVFALAIDPEDALYEYLDMYYHLGRAGKALRKVGVVEFATTVAPGVRDVLLTGKAYEACRRRRDNEYAYDAIVLDAPPTGRIGRFLNVNSEVAGLAKVGPIRRQADSIMGLLRSPRTAVHLVTLLEEMPVQETADAVAELRGLGIPIGAVVVNQTRHPALSDEQLHQALAGSLDAQEVATGLKEAGLAGHTGLLDALVREAAAHAERVQLEAEQRVLVDSMGQPVVALPWLPDGVDLAGLYELSDRLGARSAEVPW
jgi:anion-transporting  ArsA/GET3 family ATPase